MMNELDFDLRWNQFCPNLFFLSRKYIYYTYKRKNHFDGENNSFPAEKQVYLGLRDFLSLSLISLCSLTNSTYWLIKPRANGSAQTYRLILACASLAVPVSARLPKYQSHFCSLCSQKWRCSFLAACAHPKVICNQIGSAAAAAAGKIKPLRARFQFQAGSFRPRKFASWPIRRPRLKRRFGRCQHTHHQCRRLYYFYIYLEMRVCMKRLIAWCAWPHRKMRPPRLILSPGNCKLLRIEAVSPTLAAKSAGKG